MNIAMMSKQMYIALDIDFFNYHNIMVYNHLHFVIAKLKTMSYSTYDYIFFNYHNLTVSSFAFRNN